MGCCGGADDAVPEPKRVFGASLDSMSSPDVNGDIPQVLRDAAAFLREKGMGVEGIFRRSANALKLRLVREAYNKGEKVDFQE